MTYTRRAVVSASLLALSCAGILGAQVSLASEKSASGAHDSAAGDKKASGPASLSCTEGETRTVTDLNGDEVAIPVQVDRVASAIGAFSQVAAMVDETHGARTVADIGRSKQTDLFCEVFPDSNPDDLDASNVENLIAADAQVVFGPVGMYSDEQFEQLKAANIAYVALGVKDVDALSHAVLTIGQIEGDEAYANAQRFVDYYQGWIDKGTELTADLADKPTVMQLRSNGGQYTTTNKSDICEAYFTAAGAVDVAADYSGESNGTALTVGAEQILEWNPQHIFVMYADVADEIAADPTLAEVDAVKNGNIHVIPAGTYYWSVRSGEGALMTPWLLSVLHPDLVEDLDMTAEVKSFYTDFYGYDLTDEQAAEILAGPAGSGK